MAAIESTEVPAATRRITWQSLISHAPAIGACLGEFGGAGLVICALVLFSTGHLTSTQAQWFGGGGALLMIFVATFALFNQLTKPQDGGSP